MKTTSGYKTKQKEKLLDCLMSNKDRHTNVREISAFLDSEGTPMGTATIYRQLDKLVEQGLVRKYILDGSTGACFQYVENSASCHEHFHFKCTSCGKLIHIDCQYLTGVNRHILEHHEFTVDSSQTVFYGKCSECGKAGQP